MNLNDWMQTHPDLFSSSPPLSNSDIMYYKQNNYKYVTNGQDCVIPADAPSGWYEVRVSNNLSLNNGLSALYFYGVVDSTQSVSPQDFVIKPEYEAWFCSCAQPYGTEIGSPEGEDLYMFCSSSAGLRTGGTVGFIGFAKHLSGSETRVCSLPQPSNPPATPDIHLGSYIIRQITQ